MNEFRNPGREDEIEHEQDAIEFQKMLPVEQLARLEFISEDENTIQVLYNGLQYEVEKGDETSFQPTSSQRRGVTEIPWPSLQGDKENFYVSLDKQAPAEFREPMLFHELREIEYFMRNMPNTHDMAIQDELAYIRMHFPPEYQAAFIEFAETSRTQAQEKLNQEKSALEEHEKKQLVWSQILKRRERKILEGLDVVKGGSDDLVRYAPKGLSSQFAVRLEQENPDDFLSSTVMEEECPHRPAYNLNLPFALSATARNQIDLETGNTSSRYVKFSELEFEKLQKAFTIIKEDIAAWYLPLQEKLTQLGLQAVQFSGDFQRPYVSSQISLTVHGPGEGKGFEKYKPNSVFISVNLDNLPAHEKNSLIKKFKFEPVAGSYFCLFIDKNDTDRIVEVYKEVESVVKQYELQK